MQFTETLSIPIKTTRVDFSRIDQVDFNNLPFGKVYSDHMFMADWEEGTWKNFELCPFGDLHFSPAISSLHYGQMIFEGMKAHLDPSGNPLLFRPEKNWERFNRSANRMAMPEIPKKLFRTALVDLVKMDKDWIPSTPGSSLYIRPFMFATEEFIGIKPADKFRFIIFTCPVGEYYPRPVRVMVSDKYVRAFKGGTGYAKAAGNYAATMTPIKEAKQLGYDQLLWLDGCEFKYIHEIGTMNVFFIIGDTVITPSTKDGEILEGVTRDSCIKILKDKGIKVEERKVAIDEIYDAYKAGTLKDVFGTGTAATITHISDLGYKGENLSLPEINTRVISNMLKEELDGIKKGLLEDKHNWMFKVT